MEIQLFTNQNELQHLVQNLSKYDSTVLGVYDTEKGTATISCDKNLTRKYMEIRHPQVFETPSPEPIIGKECAELLDELWSNEYE